MAKRENVNSSPCQSFYTEVGLNYANNYRSNQMYWNALMIVIYQLYNQLTQNIDHDMSANGAHIFLIFAEEIPSFDDTVLWSIDDKALHEADKTADTCQQHVREWLR